MSTPARFIRSVLGPSGAQALQKAVDRQPDLSTALFPRAVMAWLAMVAPVGFQGMIPGSAFGIEFTKSEGEVISLDSYRGSIQVKGHRYQFKDANLYHIAALIASALGEEDIQDTSNLKDIEIARLGKSLDQLVIARAVAESQHYEELRKSHDDKFSQAAFRNRITNAVVPTGPLHDLDQLDDEPGFDAGHYEEGFLTEEGIFVPREVALTKVESPGKAAAPKPPIGPVAPTPAKPPKIGGATLPKPVAPAPAVGALGKPPGGLPGAAKTAKPKLPGMKPKLPSLKVAKSELGNVCLTCGQAQFSQNIFTGCLCLQDGAKFTKSESKPDGVLISFDPAGWCPEDIAALLMTIRGE